MFAVAVHPLVLIVDVALRKMSVSIIHLIDFHLFDSPLSPVVQFMHLRLSSYSGSMLSLVTSVLL